MAIYPNGYFTWADRADLVNIDYAADINSVAHEVMAMETALGENPQVEKNPPSGTAITYSNLDTRVSDAMLSAQKPVCSLNNPRFGVQTGASAWTTYNKQIDTHGMYNGQDITIAADGWYNVYCAGHPNPANYPGNGWSMIMLYVNSLYVANAVWRWDFPNWSLWPIQLLTNAGHLHISWSGACHKGDRIRVMAVNGTYYNPSFFVDNVLKVSYIRKLTNFVTG